MNIDGKAWRTIWLELDGRSVGVIDQTQLPHRFTTQTLLTCTEAADAIRTMVVRGAPLIGVTGAYGLMLALQADPSDGALAAAFAQLNATRPTAINLRWALERVRERVAPLPPAERAEAAKAEAAAIADEDVAMCEAIGEHGLQLFQQLAAARPPERQHEPLRVLTHCNAGWLPRSIGARPWPPFTRPTVPGSTSTCGSMRPARATRAPASPPLSWAARGCRTR